MAANKINFRIKLMSGNNVVLIEADGYESELFMPHIQQDGRITFLNIIPNRRCCLIAAHNGSTLPKGHVKTERRSIETKLSRMSLEYNKENMSQLTRPLANSTPATVGKNRVAETCTFLAPKTFGSRAESTLPTPEPFRKAAAPQRQLIDNNLYKLPKGLKVMRLYHNSQDGTPSKVGRLVCSSNMNSVTREDLHNLSQGSNMSCSFRIPTTPSRNGRKNGAMVSSTPLNKQLSVGTPNSNGKWRKCKTPIRTYSKRNNLASKRKTSLSSIKRASRPETVVPSYLVNPTKGPEPTHRIELKKRRLVVDSKVRISSRAFKRQQHKQNAATQSYKSIIGPSNFHRSLQRKRKTPATAFDLLTNSNRSECMSAQLNKLFRRGCVNKASSTYSKYKLLCSIPALQEDEQVLELTQMSLSTSTSVEQIPKNRINGSGNSNTATMTTRTTTMMPPRNVTVNPNPILNGQIKSKYLQQPSQPMRFKLS